MKGTITMKITARKSLATVAVSAAMLTAAGCGSSSTDSTASGDTSASASESASPSESAAAGSDVTANLVGSGCADYAKAVPSGAGSVEGMAQDKVPAAASNNPLLKTLVAAVSGKLNPKVNLVDALNQPGPLTVFAPVDSAFAKLPKATVAQLAKPANAKMLSDILTYHVVAGELLPADIAGKHKTLQGGEVTVAGSGDNLTVDGSTKVICGGVKTANATVYLIDTVLSPKA